MYPETHTVRLASKECAYGNQSKAGRGQIIIGLVDRSYSYCAVTPLELKLFFLVFLVSFSIFCTYLDFLKYILFYCQVASDYYLFVLDISEL